MSGAGAGAPKHKVYDALKCLEANGGASARRMSFALSREHAHVLLGACALARSSGAVLTVSQLLEARVAGPAASPERPDAQAVFHARAEVRGGAFCLEAGGVRCEWRPAAALARHFGLAWEETDREWWEGLLPPGWSLVSFDGRRAATVSRSAPGATHGFTVDGRFLGELRDALRAGWEEERAPWPAGEPA